MATVPSSSLPEDNSRPPARASPNELLKKASKDGLMSVPGLPLHAIQKANNERPASAGRRGTLSGTYHLKLNGTRGKHMVQYVYANPRDPNDESLPAHIREKYKEIERERLRGYQHVSLTRRTTSNGQETENSQNTAGSKLPRPFSANCDRRFAHSATNGTGSLKPEIDGSETIRGTSLVKDNQRTVTNPIMQTRSNNAVLPQQRNSRSRNNANSPRCRRPFSIAADSTSDTDPVDNQRNIESVHKSPPRINRSRQVRRQQYLATKFKLAARNSKHTQTFVAAVSGLSVDESSGSATTVISRNHSATQTDNLRKKIVEASSQPDLQVSHNADELKNKVQKQAGDTEKPPFDPNSSGKVNPKGSNNAGKELGNTVWKKAKLRLRSTPGSPSPPPPENRHRVLSADRVQATPCEKPSCLVGGRAASGQNIDSTGISRDEKKFTTSSTQIDGSQTRSTGIQVKLKRHTRSRRRDQRAIRSPSQRSQASKQSLRSESKLDDDRKRVVRKKVKRIQSREPSVRSLRSFQSNASTGNSKHVKISPRASRSKIRKPSSTGRDALGHKMKKKKKKKKKTTKKKESSNKIARFLRQLSKDKEAIQVINKMAAANKKKPTK